jgi:hypothetical protein
MQKLGLIETQGRCMKVNSDLFISNLCERGFHADFASRTPTPLASLDPLSLQDPWATITMRTSKTTRPVRALFARNHPSVDPCPLTSLLLSPPSQTILKTTKEARLRPQRRRPRPRRRNGRSSGGSKQHASHWYQPLADRKRSRCSKPTSAEGRRRHHSRGG